MSNSITNKHYIINYSDITNLPFNDIDTDKLLVINNKLTTKYNNTTLTAEKNTFFDDIPIKQIACNEHTLFLTEDNKVYACGENGAGQLGLSNFNNSDNITPRLISYFNHNNISITRISVGDLVSIFFNF